MRFAAWAVTTAWRGGPGADTLIGGAGDDVYWVDHPDEHLVELAGEGSDSVRSSVDWTLGTGFENLELAGDARRGTGNEVANRLIGSSGRDTLLGLAGADRLDGGGGGDSLVGGEGDDVYGVDSAEDAVVELVDGGIDTVEASISWVLGDELEHLTLTGMADISGTGNAADNRITGNDGRNRLVGGGGNDILAGGRGDDIYLVDDANLALIEHALGGIDTVEASVTMDLPEEVENLVLTGLNAIDGRGNRLNNRLTGNAGSNLLDGGAGRDTLAGGLGDDTYWVDDSGDTVIEAEAAGMDTVVSWVTHSLAVGIEKLALAGSANLSGTGNSMANEIVGNGGNNRLDGGGGADTLVGGLGDDVYLLESLDDTIIESPSGATTP